MRYIHKYHRASLTKHQQDSGACEKFTVITSRHSCTQDFSWTLKQVATKKFHKGSDINGKKEVSTMNCAESVFFKKSVVVLT